LPPEINRITLEEALAMAQKHFRVASGESVPLQQASGRILHQYLRAVTSLPKFDVSEKDGFAVSRKDLARATPDKPVRLRISQRIGLGPLPIKPLRPGTCARILTGGFLPPNSDSVVMQEDVLEKGEYVCFKGQPRPCENVYPRGADVKEGEELFAPGHILRPEDVNLLVSLGTTRVEVSRVLDVSILATGSELVQTTDELGSGKVLESNKVVIKNKLNGFGFLASDAGIVGDNASEIAKSIEDALQRSDALVTTGGSSVGGADLVEDALRMIGAKILFHGVKLRPSSTAALALKGGKPIFSLSGLLQSCLVAIYYIVIPTLAWMRGDSDSPIPRVRARLEEGLAIGGEKDFMRAVWCKIEERGATLFARPLKASSHSRSVIVKANGIFLAKGGSRLAEGDFVLALVPGKLP
jgi:molybdopterin molybdotransferase